MSDEAKGNGEAAAPVVVFDYLKSAHFRVIYATGAIGGLTPEGNIHFALYNERQAIPRQTVHPLKDPATLGEEILDRRVSREGIVREMEVDVILSAHAAEGLIVWLQNKINELKKRKQS